MKQLFSNIIAGGSFIFIDFWVGVDLLPDAIGWFAIASGFEREIKSLKGAKQGKAIAMIIGIINLPLVVKDVVIYLDTQMPVLSFFYTLLIGVTTFIFLYYFFQVAEQIAKLYGSKATNGTKWMKYFMLGTQLILIWVDILSPHVVLSSMAMLSTLFLIVVLMVYISFVGYLIKMREHCKKPPHNYDFFV